MEIRDYLRAIRRILPLLIILPIVAAAITGFFLEKQPSKYQVAATVVVPAISGNGTSQSAASQYVDTFKDVLVSEPIVANVSKKYGIPQSQLVTGLSADTITASSNIIHVTLSALKNSNLEAAVREATVETMDAIAQPSVTQANNEVLSSQALLNTANNNIANWAAANGNYAPQLQYNNEQSALNNQEINLTKAQLSGDKALVGVYTANITKLKQQLAVYAVQLTEYQALSNALSAALGAHDHALQVQNSALALVATDRDPSTVTVLSAVRVSKLSDVIKFAGIAFALALLMLLGLILILELMRSSRRAVAAVPTEQGSFAWGSAPPASSQAEGDAPAAPAASGNAPRDPWRAGSPPPSPTGQSTGGNGNGNGHSETPGTPAGSEQSERGVLRRQ
jgi:hypothetical protein